MPKKRKSNTELAIVGSHPHDDEQIIPAGEPEQPGDITSCEQRVWEETTQILSDAGRLTGLDGGALHAYARAVCEWRSAYADLKAHGPYQTAGTGATKLSAQLQRFNLCDRTLQRWTAELGMSPKSRPAAIVQPDSGGSELDRILNAPETDADGNTYEVIE